MWLRRGENELKPSQTANMLLMDAEKNATMKHFCATASKLWRKLCEHVHHRARQGISADCKLITCQREETMIFTDMDRDHGSEIKVTRKSRLEWWWRAGEHIIIRFYLNFIETFCLFLLHSFFLLGVCSAPIDHNKTNEKDNWVWRIKNYRYDIGESSPDIEYRRCRMHFSCCCCRSRSSASWLSETRSRYWWLNKDNHIAASAKALVHIFMHHSACTSGNPVSYFNVARRKIQIFRLYIYCKLKAEDTWRGKKRNDKRLCKRNCFISLLCLAHQSLGCF